VSGDKVLPPHGYLKLTVRCHVNKVHVSPSGDLVGALPRYLDVMF